MVIIYHQNNRVTKIVSAKNESIAYDVNRSIVEIFLSIAQQFPNAKIVWCHQLLKDSLKIDLISNLFHHNKLLLSYSNYHNHFLGDSIGFVEQSPFINVNKEVRYPTWLMNSDVGVIHASVLNVVSSEIKSDKNFDYFLSSVAKVSMSLGLLCYSEPNLLLKNNVRIPSQKKSLYSLFRFVKQHYKTRWIFLLFINLLIYKKRFSLFPLLYSLLFISRKNEKIYLNTIGVESSLKVIDKKTIDIIIPTIGRREYLYDVLKDLAQQTHLPVNVIIIEQNPLPNSVSDLDFLDSEIWPFIIKHSFTHQPGACNARNLALSQVESEWIFLADDDIRFTDYFIEKALDAINKFGVNVASVSCLQNSEKKVSKIVKQWGSFGSGCSIVKNESLKKIKFNTGYEFGYGEDSDFGMQLRNQGNDVLYLPTPEILHLKAPIGGFRKKPKLLWHDEKIQPKPSPTVMLYILINNTKEQLLGYKTTLFFKYYRHQKIKNPFRYFINFQKQWKKSVLWANQLKTSS